MAPSIVLDTASDVNIPPLHSSSAPTKQRSLVLSPPSLSSHPEQLNAILDAYNRDVTDLQMLDRLALGLVSLPGSAYDLIILLSDADGSRTESARLVSRDVFSQVVRALKAGGRLRSHDGAFGSEGPEQTEAILAGLIPDGKGGLTKPDYGVQQSVPLRFGKNKKKAGAVQPSNSNPGAEAQPAVVVANNANPAGVGVVDFSDDFGMPVANADEESEGELIDEDELLNEEDMGRPIVQPPECRPKAGKRRRACKDCTCGLAQKLDAEDASRRANADKVLESMKLGSNELAEVDFTVQGKVGSCGNCALGDAFRCDGCPYIGLPAFKPGEEVRLLNNDIQL